MIDTIIIGKKIIAILRNVHHIHKRDATILLKIIPCHFNSNYFRIATHFPLEYVDPQPLCNDFFQAPLVPSKNKNLTENLLIQY